MDVSREIKEEPCLEETLNEEYNVSYTDFENKINSATKYEDTNLSNAYEVASEIDIKDEPSYSEVSLNEMKTELEKPNLTNVDLKDEANFKMGCNSDNVMLNGYKMAIKTSIKKEDKTLENTKGWLILSLDSSTLSQKAIKETVGREGNPETQPLRLPADTASSDRHDTSRFFNSAQTLQTKEVSVKYSTDDVPGVGDKFFRQISSSRDSVEVRNTVTPKHKKPYKCLICDKRFRYSYYLRRHMVVHSGEKAFACDICEKRFTQKAQLKTHNLVHTGMKPHKCEFCDMSFTQVGNLKKHMSTHSGFSGLKQYKCDVCEKSYFAKCILKRHMLTHSGVKPFKCDVCQKRFSESSGLTRHKLLHSIIHKCDVCEKTFARRAALNKHKFASSHT